MSEWQSKTKRRYTVTELAEDSWWVVPIPASGEAGWSVDPDEWRLHCEPADNVCTICRNSTNSTHVFGPHHVCTHDLVSPQFSDVPEGSVAYEEMRRTRDYLSGLLRESDSERNRLVAEIKNLRDLSSPLTKSELGDLSVLVSDEIYRLTSAATMGREQTDQGFFGPRAGRLENKANEWQEIRAKLTALLTESENNPRSFSSAAIDPDYRAAIEGGE